MIDTGTTMVIGTVNHVVRHSSSSRVSLITWFDFIIIFLLVYIYLSHLAGITVKLQGKTMDIIAAHQMTSEVKAT